MKIETKYKFKDFLATPGNEIIERPGAVFMFEHIAAKVLAIHILTTKRRFPVIFEKYKDEIINLAKQKGYDLILSHVPKNNATAISLEKGIGFTSFGETTTHYILGRVI